ncbi:mitochondrial 18 KDa protein-domain-containing protein [Massariosphaeria phaeospora]|uniref:Mitochondrial fission process protein 1 n=1 Tax=Massariosphaeria phaeospora TaxID=100035 RepID=A0A7C8IIA3_9PLEO|nr:mitochondrial 18 KDa protein-domain-containing protein [Massariosphaeria phaeospora]
MAKDSKRPTEADDVPHERAGTRPDFSVPPPRKQLPKELQDTLDSEEKLWELMVEGKSEDTTDTSIRYAAYASRIRTIMLSAHRYVAYTSDIGESFRPIAHPWLVRSAYGISWLYLTGDVANEGYKAYVRNQKTLHPELYTEDAVATTSSQSTGVAATLKNLTAKAAGAAGLDTVSGSAVPAVQMLPGHVPAIEDYRAVMAQRAVFQGVASMGLPAFMIHSIVRYSGRALKDAKNKTVRTWGPIGLGLAAVPFLPYIFDEPVEHATEWLFHAGFKAVGGPKAVAGRPVTGNKELRSLESHTGHSKEKEL